MARKKDWNPLKMKGLHQQVFSSPRVLRRNVKKQMEKQGVRLSAYEAQLIVEEIIASRKQGKTSNTYTL